MNDPGNEDTIAQASEEISRKFSEGKKAKARSKRDIEADERQRQEQKARRRKRLDKARSNSSASSTFPAAKPDPNDPSKLEHDSILDYVSDEGASSLDDSDDPGDSDPDGTNDDSAFLSPSRWWFESTAFPLIAGTFGPIASAFSILAIAGHWRTIIPAGASQNQGLPVTDPAWELATNAVSLAIAIIANMALLLNMAQRVSFEVAMPVTIIGWYLSAAILVAITAAAGLAPSMQLVAGTGPQELGPGDVKRMAQSWYYAIFAAGLYIIIATLMLFTMMGAIRGHYPRQFKLTMAQRTLMLQTIAFLTYLLCWGAVFARIEGWLYTDAVYWADVTLLTVGLGDLSPTTQVAEGLLFPFAIGGIVILGLVIGSIRSLVLERSKKKLGARMVEKKREKALNTMQKKEKRIALTPVTGRSMDRFPSLPLSQAQSQAISTSSEYDNEKSGYSTPSNLPTNEWGQTELDRRRAEFRLMRRVQHRAHVERQYTALLVSSSAALILWFAGAAIFMNTERDQGWDYMTSLYFTYTSLLTIGYGDNSPQSNAGRPFFVFWSLLAVPSLTILISDMGDTVVKGVKDATDWVGKFTILPGEERVRDLKGMDKVQAVMEIKKKLDPRARRRRRKNNQDDIRTEPPGLIHFDNEARHARDAESSGSSSENEASDEERNQSGKGNQRKEAAKKSLRNDRKVEREQNGHGHANGHHPASKPAEDEKDGSEKEDENEQKTGDTDARKTRAQRPQHIKILSSLGSPTGYSAYAYPPKSSSRSHSRGQRSSRSSSAHPSSPSSSSTPQAHSEHHYLFLVASAIRTLVLDLGAVPPRKYTYDEWRHFLYLLGENEEDPRYHAVAQGPPIPKMNPGGEALAHVERERQGVAQQDDDIDDVQLNDAEEENGISRTKKTDEEAAPTSADGRRKRKERTPWSWAGVRSPLLGLERESEWIIKRLSARLEKGLKKMADAAVLHDDEESDDRDEDDENASSSESDKGHVKEGGEHA